ncbi:MAG: hypothetical protein CMN95_00505 [Synechococcus sp. MED650]|nr:hypothetical protein [Synechococcus sp. MED650]MEC8688801.1 DUF6561 domain-containing protein [Cyanobacteriota bacterium]OUW57748.1 MAG: hypothetical protein CBD48_00385 [Cyanobacteria bacterium TMED188]
MPGPVVNGVRSIGAVSSAASNASSVEAVIPLVSEGSIRLLLLGSGDLLIARLRNTTDGDGDPAYQLIRPRLVRFGTLANDRDQSASWSLHPYLPGLTPQRNVVLFKTAVASILEPDPLLLQAYSNQTNQECPLEETPVERLKRAFQEFTESFEAQSLDD